MFNNHYLARAEYYLATDSLNKALKYINKSDKVQDITTKLSILAKMGTLDSIKNIFDNKPVYASQKAIVYALLKEKDSMYYFLNKCFIYEALVGVNGNNTFNPYRKEERYKAFLKKNYLPIGIDKTN